LKLRQSSLAEGLLPGGVVAEIPLGAVEDAAGAGEEVETMTTESLTTESLTTEVLKTCARMTKAQLIATPNQEV